jgi:pilus assembly protein Flp/PilA
MKRLGRLAKAWVSDESGATAIEYSLLGSLLAIAIIAALQSLGSALSNEFTEISGAIK